MRSYLYNLATDKQKGPCAAVIKFFLYLLSLIYGVGVRVLAFIRSLGARGLNCKVISVGNITLGGTGKTTLVEFIARYLKEQGRKPAILSRGYKRRQKTEDRGQSYEAMGDEAFMLQANLKDVPVIVNPDRLAAAETAIRDYGADTVIIDDGLQQWRIKKDLEIVTIDATNPFGNRHLLPRGILRLNLSSLKRADIFVLTKTDLAPDNIEAIKNTLSKLNPQAMIIESIHSPSGFYDISKPEEFLSSSLLKGRTVTLFCGIGDPRSFENLIARCAINVGLAFRFGDHHSYTCRDLEKIIEASRSKGIDTIVTTEKDAVRIPQSCRLLKQPAILVLRIALKITQNEKGFYSRLLGLYNS